MAPATVPLPSGAGLYRNFWRQAQGARGVLVASNLMLALSQMLKLAVPWLTAQAINTLQTAGASGLSRAALWVLAVVGVYIGVWMLHGPGRVLERHVAVQVRRGIVDTLYGKLTRVPLAWHEQHHSGDVQHRVSQASRALYDFAQTQFVYLQTAVNLVGPLVALALLTWWVGALAAVGYVLIGAVLVRFDMSLMKLARRENAAERRYASGLIDFLGNIGTVTSLRLQDSTRRLLAKRLAAVFEPLRRSIVLNEAKWCAVDLMGIALCWGLVAAYVVSQHGAGDAVLLGSVFMVYQYAQQAAGVIGSLAGNFQSFARVRADFSSADLIVDAPERPLDASQVPSGWSRITLQGLVFEHAAAPALAPSSAPSGEAAQPVPDAPRRSGLHGVTLTLHRGERLALVGPSGSGKSTLMRVLAGLYQPHAMHIEVDGVAQPALHHLGPIATLIPQDADVFEATVRENVAFDLPRSQAELDAAAHLSAFDEVLAAMPQGWDTPISERGFNLSGGQRQRLSLARGVLAAEGSSLLMLDEPTSALDPMTEARVIDRLHERFADACLVASVHRMSLLTHFDRVALMVGGHLVDAGTPAEVQARQPVFREMVNGQRKGQAREGAPGA